MPQPAAVPSPQASPPGLDAADKARSLALFRANAERGEGSLGWRLDAFLQAGQRRAVVRAAGFAAGQRVLDVGAGLGHTVAAAKRAGAHVTAVDHVPVVVERLRQLADVAQVGDAEQLGDLGAFERVLFIGVLEFVADPAAALARLAAHVAPGGRLVLLVPTRTWLGQLYRLEKRLHGVRVHLFDPTWCRREVERAGLALKEMSRPLPNNALMTFVRPPLH